MMKCRKGTSEKTTYERTEVQTTDADFFADYSHLLMNENIFLSQSNHFLISALEDWLTVQNMNHSFLITYMIPNARLISGKQKSMNIGVKSLG